MKLRVGRRVFVPHWLPTLVTLVVLPGLLSLGFWQLRRAEEKRVLMAQAAAGALTLRELSAANAGMLGRYQHVKVSGRYDSQYQILLDNMPSNEPATQGQPGYRVLTPLQLDSGSVLLVDRGWVALGSRTVLPDIQVADTVRELTGVLDELPQPGVRAGEAGIQPDHWPQVLNYPRWSELQTLYGDRLLPRIVLLDTDQPGGFGRSWQIRIGFTPERHVGYAVQWFGLAATLLIIYVVVNVRRVEPS